MNSASNVITLNTLFSALALIYSGELLDFSMKLLHMTWSSKCTHLVKPLFSHPPILLQIDSDLHIQGMSATDNCYKTWKCNLKYPAVLHSALNSVAIARALA